MTQEFTERSRCPAWPFWVLQLSPEAGNSDIEKSARDLTSKLNFGLDDAKTFVTPTGVFQRDEFLIREAKAQLQDPNKRVIAEFWYVAPLAKGEEAGEPKMESLAAVETPSHQDCLKMLKANLWS